MRDSNEGSSLLCVGDDWQAIYEFAGSDISYTSEFSETFGDTRRVDLDMTFRFNNKISDLAARFIMKNPKQLEKDICTKAFCDDSRVTIMSYTGEVNQALKTCIKQIPDGRKTGRKKSQKKTSLYFLGRFKHNKPKCFNTLISEYPHIHFMYDTIHSAKGREADYVIVMDVDKGMYGLPSMVQDDPILSVFLRTSETYSHAKERRLFYVALTRAKHHCYIITSSTKHSPFVKELIKEQALYGCNTMNEVGELIQIKAAVKCPHCIEGDLEIRGNKNDGNSFYGCSNYPLCSHTEKLCPECSKGVVVKCNGQYQCSDCGYQQSTCPACKSGVLQKKTGRNGEFIACSNYRSKNCTYTKSL